MDVDDAKIRDEAKAILKEIMDPSPDPKKAQIEIWEAWFDPEGRRRSACTRRSQRGLRRGVLSPGPFSS
jgi:hypothetical protein